MPKKASYHFLKRGSDSKGPFFKWGVNGNKYHYKKNDKITRDIAREKAKLDGVKVVFNYKR